MAPSDVCPTEDAVKAFLEQLVDPMLPAKSSIRDNPTSSQQQSVAKQVHSVVLLYNYYHRKHHPELEFLKFDEFCKLAVVLRPTLLTHMKYMQKSDKPELVDVEKQLSLTEKKIMDACDICTCLDASKNVRNVERWPISKVAVLLVDSKKENCVLLFSSITEGVWSVVEKDVDTPSQNSEVASGTRFTYKKRRVIKKPTKDESNVDEAGFLQVGYSAVKEAAGIDKTGIMLLESCTVYSHSKEKAASRFYIMKCSQFSEEVKRVPIKDLIESLQGPLVKKSSRNWTVTPVVEYFHVLPYSETISDWISRETFSNSLQDSKLAEKNIMADGPEVKESHASNKSMFVGLANKPSSDNIESPSLKQKETTGSCIVTQSDSINEAQDMNVDSSNSLQDSKLAEKNIMADSPEVKESHASNKGMFVGLANKPSSDNIESPSQKQKENTGSCIVTQLDSINEAQHMNVDNSNSLQDSKLAGKYIMADSPEVKELHASNKGMFVGLADKPSSDNIEFPSLKQKENTGRCIVIQSDSINEAQDINVDNSTLFPSQIIEECQHIANTSQVSEDQEKKNISVQHYSNGSSSLIKAENDDLTRMFVTEGGIKNLSACNQICADTSSEKNAGDKYALITNNSNSDLEKLQILLASKGETLSQTAVTALIGKRNDLALQQRMIEDEIALCDLKIQRILAGGDDDLELKIDSIIEGCNDICVRNQGRIYGHLEDQSSPPCFKRKRLTEAVLTMQSPCQELDGICHENNWILPTYRVSQSDGGFQANVTVKGLDFECSHQGNQCSYPREARESAAALMLANLRSMAKSDH